ncbi:putative Zn finger protein [Micromonospora kangleipakensis]|uniref:Putative Zn finger protein n=1 Tax=Micromonospora kangleipakensis TaxID=1077942 RepID=A0A4Q8BJ89_9ACTN|nr:SWIM zinc finger family protein [Micromonospora kangleipakensis]RZU77409.1 putative Zn finger protein [Micromonospora kangleipakensis]
MSTPDGNGAGRFAEFGPPRRVAGGLRARSTRGAIGQSWWSRRFLEVLESFALGTRLTRGRAYARRGQVLRLDIAPGVVTAAVQGSRPDPYPVRIELAAHPAQVWARIEAELAGQAFFSARLLAGDLPAELEELFARAGAPLFPSTVDELAQRCGCPDFAVPCKHLAATFYLLAEAFDADPFQLLHWRGRSRAELLDRLRTLRAAAGATATPPETVAGGSDVTTAGSGPATEPANSRPAGPAAAGPAPAGRPTAAGAARVLGALPAASSADPVDRFWVAPVPLPDRPPTLATAPDLLLRQLGPPGPAIGGPGLVERLRRAFRDLGRPRSDRPTTAGPVEATPTER